MLIAVISVAALIWLTLGLREAGIVFIAIPVTLALTLATFYLYGFTLNRITLFALIFSIGILVDDAIVIVENIVRHARMPHNQGRGLAQVAVEAVDEVGSPTILATLTVIAAILPNAFVSGLSGPYMRPIPIAASAAMLFSLIAALVVTPWASVRILGAAAGHAQPEAEDRLTRLYRRVMNPLLHRTAARYGFLTLVATMLLGAIGLVAVGLVKMKMLPFDNKSEFQVIIDMPEGTTLEETARVAGELAAIVRRQPEVVNLQTYASVASPYNFNGVVRHYFLRRGPNVADIQVNLVGSLSAGSRVTTSPSASASNSPLWPSASARASRSLKCPLGRRCWTPWSPKCTARRSRAKSRSRGRSGASSRRRAAWSMLIGMWKTISQSTAFVWTARKPRSTESPARMRCVRCAWERGRFRRLAPRLRRERRRADYGAPCAGLALRSGAPEEFEAAWQRRQPRCPRRNRAHRAHHRGQEHLPQEPDAGDLRHSRPGRRHRKPRLCHAEGRARDRANPDP
jgi:hypothetical protein